MQKVLDDVRTFLGGDLPEMDHVALVAEEDEGHAGRVGRGRRVRRRTRTVARVRPRVHYVPGYRNIRITSF